ncbi:MAG: ribose-5-phosphate isomerase RpiA [Alphaproteobacteria bacterium]
MSEDADRQKRRAAGRSLDFIADGMTLGLGTGSTAAHVVRLLGERVRDGLSVTAVPTSRATETLARDCGIPLAALEDVTRLDLTIDGADEVDPELRLIKGGGGALLHEKIVASASARFVVVADSSKLVPRLGAFPLPVEAVPFAWKVVAERLGEDGHRPTLRRGRDGKPFVTDDGNYILDCACGVIADPEALARRLDAIAGVVEHGLFLGMADCVVVGRADGAEVIGRSAAAPGR